MPTKRRTAANNDGDGSSRSTTNPQSDDNYKLKRQRNNDAVKKTRAKSKNAAQERRQNIERLTQENAELVAKLKSTREHIQYLKGLLLGQNQAEDQSGIEKVLQSSDVDE